MRISKITLHNFRIYQGTNVIKFGDRLGENIHIIAGKNGYGKTTFLTSLIWCFYGKMMGEVEDKYRQDIKNSGGYDNLLLSYFNKNALQKRSEESLENDEFFVEIELKDLTIPSIPCKSIIIKRSFNKNTKAEKLSLLIDGDENELTKEVGYDIFINDFILPREIAKFFFFDAEKIVTLAEARSKAELRSLSKAYSEVLGIKKYEELKKNLTSLLSNLRRRGVTDQEKRKLDLLLEEQRELEKLIDYNQDHQDETDRKVSELTAKSSNIQEKLFREGNQVSLEELIELKKRRAWLEGKLEQSKTELKKLMEVLPLAIAGKSLKKLYDQLAFEHKIKTSTVDPKILEREIAIFSAQFLANISKLNLDDDLRESLEKNLDQTLKEKFESKQESTSKEKILLDFPEEKYHQFLRLYQYIKTDFKSQFEKISREEKDFRILLNNTTKKIKKGEVRTNKPIAKKLRIERESIEEEIKGLRVKKAELINEFEIYSRRKNNLKAQLSEVEKKFELIEIDIKKYKVTENLLEKINTIINSIKEEKKYALQKSLAIGLKKLMHKSNFIQKVNINIMEDIMNIQLFDKNEVEINKEDLSKGEQQLYATALLNALVEESKINFPVFIDSPLQKFDKFHSENIIKEFYPTVSDQVVLFPLLEKELSEKEFELLKDNLNTSYLIENQGEGSEFIKIKNSNRLFVEFEKRKNVYQY